MSKQREAKRWRIKRSYGIYVVDAPRRTLDRRKCWEVECPKGHCVHMKTNFDELPEPIGLPCPTCNEPVLYSITFKDDFRASA